MRSLSHCDIVVSAVVFAVLLGDRDKKYNLYTVAKLDQITYLRQFKQILLATAEQRTFLH